MTFTHKSETVGNTRIEICQDKYDNHYTVMAYEVIHGPYFDYCNYPFSKRYYHTLKQAERRFRDLVKKAENGTI